MDAPINSEKTIEIIEKMKLAKIGKYKKWQLIIKKIKNDKIIIFGNNASGKTRIIKYLDEAISNCNDEIIIKKIAQDMFDLQKKNMDPSMRIVYDNSRSKGNIIADIANNFVTE